MRIGRWFIARDADGSWAIGKEAVADKTAEEGGEKIGVLFVCLGNICRSPMAEGAFRAALDRAGLADRVMTASAGLGDWHVGLPPDKRAIEAAKRRGYDLSTLRGRKVEPGDFAKFDLILCMDETNLAALTKMKPDDFSGHLGLLLDFAPATGVREVPDPYYGAPAGFDRVLDLIEASTPGLLARLQPLLKRD